MTLHQNMAFLKKQWLLKSLFFFAYLPIQFYYCPLKCLHFIITVHMWFGFREMFQVFPYGRFSSFCSVLRAGTKLFNMWRSNAQVAWRDFCLAGLDVSYCSFLVATTVCLSLWYTGLHQHLTRCFRELSVTSQTPREDFWEGEPCRGSKHSPQTLFQLVPAGVTTMTVRNRWVCKVCQDNNNKAIKSSLLSLRKQLGGLV